MWLLGCSSYFISYFVSVLACVCVCVCHFRTPTWSVCCLSWWCSVTARLPKPSPAKHFLFRSLPAPPPAPHPPHPPFWTPIPILLMCHLDPSLSHFTLLCPFKGIQHHYHLTVEPHFSHRRGKKICSHLCLSLIDACLLSRSFQEYFHIRLLCIRRPLPSLQRMTNDFLIFSYGVRVELL